MPCPPLLSIVYLIWAYYEFNPFVFVGYLNNCLHKSLARRSHRIEAAAASAHNFHSTPQHHPPPPPTRNWFHLMRTMPPCTLSFFHYFSSLLTPSRGQLLRRCSLSALSAAVWLRVCLPESELCSAAATCPRPLLRCPCASACCKWRPATLMGDPLPWGIPAMFSFTLAQARPSWSFLFVLSGKFLRLSSEHSVDFWTCYLLLATCDCRSRSHSATANDAFSSNLIVKQWKRFWLQEKQAKARRGKGGKKAISPGIVFLATPPPHSLPPSQGWQDVLLIFTWGYLFVAPAQLLV